MRTRYKLIGLLLLVLGVLGALTIWLAQSDIAIFNPAGQVAEKQRNLIIFGSALSLLIVLPVFAMTFYIAWKYRAGNKKAEYKPDWDHSRLAESIWWLVPLALIIVLSVVTYKSSHDLDPFKPLASDTKPLNIQVVAMEWKWLFIYPEQNMATVNFVQFPENTPVTFTITSDAPMNSFWIPRLGGQIYAMSGMSTKLHLEASEQGTFSGVSANLSGAGFAGMQFTAKASSQADFDAWVQEAKRTPHPLNVDSYNELATPSTYNRPTYYSSAESDLYDTILMKYMDPAQSPLHSQASGGHGHGDGE